MKKNKIRDKDTNDLISGTSAETNLPPDPEDPLTPDNDPDIILDPEEFEPPQYETPPEGEGP